MKPDFSFPKSARILTSEGFSSVFDHVDFRVSSKHILILVRHSSPSDTARMGLIVAKKHVKLATDRNRLKRIARESFRQNRSRIPSCDLVVLYKSGSGKADNAKLLEDFTYLWRKVDNKANAPRRIRGKPHEKNSK